MKLKMKLLILVVSLTLVKTQDSTGQNSTINVNEEKDNEVQKTFQLLEEGQQKILLSEERNLVLVLGNTGSGKSTFIQWLFGDNEKLIAKQTDGGAFIIEDGNHRISNNSAVKSKTLFPELVMDGSTNTAYYDCPGFSDTSHDIPSAYFIKRVVDYAERVKLIFIVNFSSLSKGANRVDFVKLLTHATDLIKDINKFRDSMAIIATKVDNSFVEDELISDDVVINGIAEFLVEAKDALTTDSSKIKYVQLINVFLSRNIDGVYDRIGIFRRPSRKGPLSKLPMLQSGKKHVLRILKTIVFANKSAEDFGYTISDRSMADIIIIYLTRRIEVLISQFGVSLSEHYAEKLQEAKIQLLNFTLNSTHFRDIEVYEIKEMVLRLKDGLTIMSDMRPALSDPLTLKGIISRSIYDIHQFRLNETYVKNVSFQLEVLSFLLLARNISFHSLNQHWSSTIERVIDGYATALKYFTNTVAKASSAAVYSSVLTDFNSVAEIIKNHCERTMFTSLDSVNACYLPLWNLSVESYHASNSLTFLSDIVDNCLKKFATIDERVVNHVVKRIAFLEYVQALSERDLLSHVIPFMTFQPFDQVFRFVREGREWYYFLISLSLKFSEYEMQKDVSRYNVADLEDWGKVNKTPGRFSIDRNSFPKFLDKLSHIFIDDDIRSMEIREVHLAALDKVLDTHFRSKFRAVCEKESIVLRGNFIKFSDFIDEKGDFKSPCPLFHALNINIYASKTLFVDRDLIGVGKGYRISAMAPRWEVIGHGRSIVLDGADGASFLGVGRFFINGAQLRISAINGVGGGQGSGRVNIIELGQPSKISKS